MRIVAAGGGSGGHVTPVLAVINELKKCDPQLEVCFVTDHAFGSQASEILKSATVSVRVKKIVAGKFRRYHKVHWFKQLIDLPTVLKNLRDVFYVGVGLFQSLWLLFRFKPDVVFTKGGFVCVPVGVAAHWLKIPLVIHDSDARPGLANQILARWAKIIATGSPLENYHYPLSRSHYVGIPIDSNFKPVTENQQLKLKSKLGLPDIKKPLVVVTGGGLGARNINSVVGFIAPQLIDQVSFYHVVGEALYEEFTLTAPPQADYIAVPFVFTGMADVLGAADIVISRAGSTTLQELAGLAKAAIIIPHPNLADQQKNIEMYKAAKAVLPVDENRMIVNPLILKKSIQAFLDNPVARAGFAKRLHAFAKPDAAVDMAGLIVEAISANKHQKAVE